MINPTYFYWFLLYGIIVVCIILLHWRTNPNRENWKKFIIIGLVFIIPYQILNILGITVFKLWENNAISPFPTLFGSPLETIPFSFLGAILSLLLFRVTRNSLQKGLIWVLISLFCAFQAYLSTLFGFMMWIHWNFLASLILWVGIIGILIGLEIIYNRITQGVNAT